MGQLIVTRLIQTIKVPSIAVTRSLPLYNDLLDLAKIYLHYTFKKPLVKLALKQVKKLHMPIKHVNESLLIMYKKSFFYINFSSLVTQTKKQK